MLQVLIPQLKFESCQGQLCDYVWQLAAAAMLRYAKLLQQRRRIYNLLFFHRSNSCSSIMSFRYACSPQALLLACTCFILTRSISAAFTQSAPSRCQSHTGWTRQTRARTCTIVGALSERQLQFWEDVEDGIAPIASFYTTKETDRVRTFIKSCKGDISPPAGYALDHQPSEEHIDGLSAKPFWDSSDFEWGNKLEEHSDVILKEFEENLLKREGLFSGDSAWQIKVMGDGWSAFRLQRMGVWNSENVDLFPKTYELLRSLDIPLAVRGVCFARQSPQTGVKSHSDGRNFILTAHLGLQVPEGVWVKVGGETRCWNEGKLAIMDTSFSHSTGNPTDSDRHVLIIDFWHPELSEGVSGVVNYDFFCFKLSWVFN